MELTTCQEKAAQAFLAFMASEDKEFVISGPAGTGKTFMIQHMINMLDKANAITDMVGTQQITSVAITATTNKAAEVLQRAFPSTEVRTIHSTLGLTIKNNVRTGTTSLVKGNRYSPLSHALIIIDEASMVNTELRDVLQESLRFHCRIVYIGDHCQLLPVGEDSSPVFDAGLPSANLITPVRTSSCPELTEVNSILRRMVDRQVFSGFPLFKGQVEHMEPEDLEIELMETMVAEDNDCRILAFTNEVVQQFNVGIREAKGLTLDLQVGDTIIANNAADGSGKSRTRIESQYVIQEIGYSGEVRGVPCKSILLGGAGYFLVADSYEVLNAAMKREAADKNWSAYFELKESVLDARFSYAATSHKAQGSTYHTVYIDLDDLRKCRDPNMFIRLLYVAVSRASHRVVMTGNLPSFMR